MTGAVIFFAALGAAAVVDAWKQEIPNAVHVLLGVSAVLNIFLHRQPVAGRIAGFFIVGGILLITSLATDNLGGGDVKLGACSALAAGLFPALTAMVIALFLAALFALLQRVVTRENRAVPLAPFVLCGYIAAAVLRGFPITLFAP